MKFEHADYGEIRHGISLMERPLFPLLFSMIAGLSAGLLFNFFLPGYVIFPLLGLALGAAFVKGRISYYLAISCLLFSAANASIKPFLEPEFPPNHISRFCSDEPVIIEGIIDSRPETMESGFRLYLKTEKIFFYTNSSTRIAAHAMNRAKAQPDHGLTYQAVSGRLLLTVDGGDIHYVTGDRIRFSSRLRKPRNYGMPGEFDTERFLAFRKVFAKAFVKNSDEIIHVGASGEFVLQRRIDEVTLHLGKYIGNKLPATEGAILRALLLGDMGIVPRAIKDDYTRTGVNHILSISGFHVGIIAIFIFQILLVTAKQSEFLLLRLNMRRFSLVLTLPVLVFYLLLSGTAPATLRSVIMIGVFILAMVLERESDPIDSLMLAALLILAGSPPALFDLSFQLSFLAFWGLLVITPMFVAPFESVQGKFTRKLLLFFMASAAAIATTIIPVAYYFHRTTLTGLISNFIIVPLLGYGAVVVGFTALPFVYIAPFLALPLLQTAAFLVKISDVVIMFLAKIPALPLFNPSRPDLLLFYVFMVAVTFLKGAKVRRACCLALMVLFVCSRLIQGSPDKGKLALTFFSVGQGESILINFPNGKNMLIDGGGSISESKWDVGERLLAPALWKSGIDRLDYLVLTHPHPDHLQGLKYIAANFSIGEFWEGASLPECKEYLELMEIVRRRRIPVRIMNAESAPVEIGGTKIEPLAPFSRTGTAMPADYIEMNDESLVFRLKYGEFAALLTGDISYNVEDRLLKHPGLLRCTILKVPHHGSAGSSSTAFLKAATPSIAIISAGYGNGFHLPAQQTLARLDRQGIRIYRTDLDGAIHAVCGSPRENNVSITMARHFR